MNAAPGLYLLARLDGAASAPLDLRPLGFHDDGPGATRHFACADCSLGVAGAEAGGLDLWITADQVCGFAGWLDEPEELAGVLGLPAGTSAAELAAAAVLRFGVEAAHRMLGEWELALWQRAPVRVTLLASRCRRDPVCFRLQGGVLAVAPQPMAIGRFFGALEIDPAGLALHSSRYGLRRILTDETIWKDIHQLAPGTQERFADGRRGTTHAAAETGTLPPWQGSFRDAVELLDWTGRRILRQHVDRHPQLAVQLSGGQDSTLLGCWAAQVAPDPHRLLGLCSAAPPGSGLEDESALASAAAAQLGMPLQLVVPPDDWSIYRPRAEAFAFAGSPLTTEPQPAARALQQAARVSGRTAMVGGNFGELTVTGGEINPAGRSFLRNRREQLRGWTDRLGRLREPRSWPADAFQPRFSAAVFAHLPAAWRAPWQQGAPPWVDGIPGQPIGIHTALGKAALDSSSVAPDLRLLLPFRDRRLVEAAAVLPSAFRLHAGRTRALSRALLHGRVPDTVSLRTSKLPFAPDLPLRVQRGAADALRRIALFEDAGVGGWIDLGWLREALSRAALGRVTQPQDVYSLRATAVTAEFLFWLGEQGITLNL